MSDKARVAIQGYVIKMQQALLAMVTEIQSASAVSRIVLSSYSSTLSASEVTRLGVIGVLSEQYQRMLLSQKPSRFADLFRSSSSSKGKLLLYAMLNLCSHTDVYY